MMSIPKSASQRRTLSGEPGDLINQAARSVKWTFLYNAAPRIVTPFSTIILAAVLAPDDFGLFAISTFIIALARVIVDMGLSRAVVQRQTYVNEAASISFWMNLILSACLYVVLWMTAPSIAAAYGNDKVIAVVRVAALSLPLVALAAVPRALMQRDLQFRSLFWIHTSFLILQAVASVALAFLGLGYWSLIWGQLIGFLFSAALTWSLTHWRPSLAIDWHVLRSILTFSVWVTVSAFQTWVFHYMDNAIAGLFLGTHGLGIYSLGFNIAVIVPGFLTASLGDVAYPAFCKLQQAREEVGRSLTALQVLAAAVLFPVAFGISAIAEPVVGLLYGEKWRGLGMVISFLAIMPGLSYMWSLNEKAYQAVGRPDVWMKVQGLALLALLPLLWLAAPLGLFAFTLARFAGALFLPLWNMLFGARIVGIKISEQIKPLAYPACISAAMYAIVYALTKAIGPLDGVVGWAKLFFVVCIGALSYLLLLRLTNRRLWNQLAGNLRRLLA